MYFISCVFYAYHGPGDLGGLGDHGVREVPCARESTGILAEAVVAELETEEELVELTALEWTRLRSCDEDI